MSHRDNPVQRHLDRAFKLCWIKGDMAAGLREYEAVLALAPRNVDAHVGIAQVHFFAEPPRYAEAIRALDRAIECDPRCTEPHYWRALILERQGDRKQAIAGYEHCIALSPGLAKGDARFYVALGSALNETGQPEKAIPALSRGLELGAYSSEAFARTELGLALHRAGRRDEALEQWTIVANGEAFELADDEDHEQGLSSRATAQRLLDEHAGQAGRQRRRRPR